MLRSCSDSEEEEQPEVLGELLFTVLRDIHTQSISQCVVGQLGLLVMQIFSTCGIGF